MEQNEFRESTPPLYSEADGAMLPAIFLKSSVIFMSRPDKKNSNINIMNVRLGRPLAGKADLRDIMKTANLPFGGRWNAGANKRKGGTKLAPKEFAQKIYEALNKMY